MYTQYISSSLFIQGHQQYQNNTNILSSFSEVSFTKVTYHQTDLHSHTQKQLLVNKCF